MRTITRESLTAVAPPVATSGEALVRSADDAHAAGDRPRAIELYERALHMLPSSATGTAATVLRRLGRVHWESGQLDEAIDVLQVALVAATAAGDTSCAAHAQNVLAVCHWQRGQLDEAEWLYRATRTSAVSARDAALVAMIDQNLGIIESVRGNLQSALRHYQSSLAGYRALGHRAHLGRLLSNMGMLYTALTRWDDADRAYDEAAVLCEEVGDAGARTMVEVNRVQLWLARGAVERALVACDRILGSAAAADARVLGETLKLRGIAARETGDHAGADDFLARALASARERQDPQLE
ncbi:MAG: tetratricopeptide repeat protein, partial [Gemmatimonadaceae bacterium]|nr:tetratricopeptide repeat protein [Gemmatimonadaceae bacterium]